MKKLAFLTLLAMALAICSCYGYHPTAITNTEAIGNWEARTYQSNWRHERPEFRDDLFGDRHRSARHYSNSPSSIRGRASPPGTPRNTCTARLRSAPIPAPDKSRAL